MAQTFTSLHYHMIFSTKNRAHDIKPEIRERLYGYIGGIIRSEIGTLLIAGGTDDHIHLLLEIGKNLTVPDAVRLIKTNSSKWVHETFPQMPFAWQSGYGAFTVSNSVIPKVTEYIRNQEEHHRVMTYKEELLRFLKEYVLKFDEKYMWN